MEDKKDGVVYSSDKIRKRKIVSATMRLQEKEPYKKRNVVEEIARMHEQIEIEKEMLKKPN